MSALHISGVALRVGSFSLLRYQPSLVHGCFWPLLCVMECDKSVRCKIGGWVMPRCNLVTRIRYISAEEGAGPSFVIVKTQEI